MSRGGAQGVVVTSSMVELLPAILRTDDFAADFVGGLDDVLAPVLLTIGNVSDYVDPDVAPPDFVEWLASWFGIRVDPRWSERRTRATIKRFARLQRFRGTVEGLRELVEILTGDEVEVDDGGGVWTTLNPAEELSGEHGGVVRIHTSSGSTVDSEVLDRYLPPGFTVEWA